MASPCVSVVEYRDRKNLVLCYRHPDTGRLFTRSAGTADKRDAQKAAGVWETEIEEGRWTPETRRRKNARQGRGAGPQMGWDEFRIHFESNYRGSKRAIRKATHVNNCATLNAFEEICHPRRLSDFNTDAVTAFAAGLRKPISETRTRSEATVARHLRHLRVIARWAHKQGLLPAVPAFDIPSGVNKAKARAVTPEEFDRIVEAAGQVVGETAAETWEWLLSGLWWSGLRLGEALALRWEPTPGACWPVLNGQRSVIVFDGAAQKNGKAGAVPMAPEFVEFLETLPRTGKHVFPLMKQDGSPAQRDVRATSERIGQIGKKARVVTKPATGGTATAHDLRRSFGTRWARRVLPQQLKELMRHADISTTLDFYAEANAEATSAALWESSRNQQPHQHSTRSQRPEKEEGGA